MFQFSNLRDCRQVKLRLNTSWLRFSFKEFEESFPHIYLKVYLNLFRILFLKKLIKSLRLTCSTKWRLLSNVKPVSYETPFLWLLTRRLSSRLKMTRSWTPTLSSSSGITPCSRREARVWPRSWLGRAASPKGRGCVSGRRRWVIRGSGSTSGTGCSRPTTRWAPACPPWPSSERAVGLYHTELSFIIHALFKKIVVCEFETQEWSL